MSVAIRISRSVERALHLRTGVRSFVKVGDKVPINFVKDEPAPVIKADSEYPDWVFKLGAKEPTLGELIERAETQGISDETFTVQDAKRLKRLMSLDKVKKGNASRLSSTD
eukprot:gene12055-8611_t